MTATMMDKGTDYVTAWPRAIGRKLGISAEWVILALNAVTGSALSQMACYQEGALPEVGALTPDQARAVIAEARRARDARARAAASHCHYCGLPLDRHGECAECV